jgi:urea transport system ATP-binding protein
VSAPLLEIRGIRKDFGGLQVLRGVDLALGAGELRCLIGPNGCGKTTLFNLISGAFAPSSGQILFEGREITGRPPHYISRLGIARKFQVPGLYPSLSVAENLEVPLLSTRRGAGPLALLRAGRRSAGPMRDLLDRFGLTRFASSAAGTLPHGLKQWLEIAMLLGAEPRLILLDEPTAGMSAAETSATVDLIRRIRQERGVGVLVIEHDMSFVRQLAAPVVVMLRGRVLFEGSYRDMQAHPEVREAYLGQAAAC